MSRKSYETFVNTAQSTFIISVSVPVGQIHAVWEHNGMKRRQIETLKLCNHFLKVIVFALLLMLGLRFVQFLGNTFMVKN